MRRFINIGLAALCLILASPLQGQYSLELYPEMRALYPGNNYIWLTKKITFELSLDQGEIQITRVHKDVFMLLKGSFGSVFNHSVYSSEFRELETLKAYSYHLEGGKYRRTEIKEFHEKMNVDNDVFYDDQKEISISFPSVKPGSVIEVETEHTFSAPQFLGSIFLQRGIPIHELDIVFESERDVDFDVLFLNAAEEDYQVDVIEKGKKRQYRIRKNRVEALLVEDNSPEIEYFIPHVIPLVRSYQYQGESTEVLKDVHSLYSWYYTFVKEHIEREIPAQIKTLSDSLTRNCSTEMEKVRLLYRWVQSNIRYIAFEYGLGGFIPRMPEDILYKMYGDCKDNTSILYALLKAAGINSCFTWIGTTHIPYSYEEVPSPLCDNHMILTYLNDSGYYFLDGTASYLPVEVPNMFIQGKEALIGLSEDEFRIEKVPVLPARYNTLCDTSWMYLQEEGIWGSGKQHLYGFHRFQFKSIQEGMSSHDLEKYVEDRVRKGTNKFVLSSHSVSDQDRFGTQLGIDYSFDLGSYVSSSGDELFINMNLNRPLSDYLPKQDRTQPIELGLPRVYENHFCLQIPEGYRIEYLPENSKSENDSYSFHIEYEQGDSCIWYHQHVTSREQFIEASQIVEWRDFIKTLEKQYRESIILKKYDL